jgi:hypothetical protein
LLYSTYTFSFGANIEAGVPFFSDLTNVARESVRRVQVVKKAGPYTKEFDRAEWGGLCAFLAGVGQGDGEGGNRDNEEVGVGMGIRLRRLDLGVIAGKPGDDGWHDVPPISKSEFEMLSRVAASTGLGHGLGSGAGGMDLEWVDQVMQIKGLREVNVQAFVEHCPPPRSESMRSWVQFSRSVEGGFAEWVRERMVGA